MHSIDRLMPDDWERLKALRLRALQDSPDAFGRTYAEEAGQSDEFWKERLSNPSVGTFVAEWNLVDCGMVSGVPLPSAGPRVMALFGMWVDPTARRQGIGALLVHRLVEWAREQGFDRMHLGVVDTNRPAWELYTRLGFAPTGEREVFPSPRQHLSEHKMVRVL